MAPIVADPRRGYCPSCGAALAWQSLEDDGSLDLTIGTADRPDQLKPREHLWTASAISWLYLQDDLPRHRTHRGS